MLRLITGSLTVAFRREPRLEPAITVTRALRKDRNKQPAGDNGSPDRERAKRQSRNPHCGAHNHEHDNRRPHIVPDEDESDNGHDAR